MVLMECIRPAIEILTGIATVIGILTCLWPCCVTHANYISKLQENGDSLEEALNELKNVRDDVQKKVDDAESNPNEPMKRNDQVNGWLQSVTATEGEVLEILRQVDQQTSIRCLGGCSPDNCWSGYMLGRSVVQYIASLDELRKKGGFEEVAYKLPPPSVQEEPTNTIEGMKSMFEKVWSSLAEDEVKIMGIYGQGGVGKTTLLKQINNAFLKTTATSSSSSSSTHSFDVVILVVVSKVINIDTIQKEIGDRLGLSSPDRRSIFNVLAKKSFVLLLDDIWERVDLQSLGIPPPHETKKSKIVFTTRSEVVCGLMEANEMLKVECLPWNEAWSLFEKKVGERALNSFPRARELAEVVARECCGLPLALITIGRAMSTKKSLQEWNHAITTLQRYASEFPGMGDEVLPILKVSYDNLRNDIIKSCFLYCALFPEDEPIYILKLIDYWIGEGFISLSDFNHIDEARNYGYVVIGDLKGACLMEAGEIEDTSVKMHDTIRDLALWIAHECGSKRDKLCIIKTSDITAERSSSWYNNAERIYLIPSPREITLRSPPQLKFPNLITLILHHFLGYSSSYLSVLPQNFFEFTPLLRVLNLSNCNMETFPICITELVELRYLSLSETDIKELPEELGKLVTLNYLDLSGMVHLKKIPSGVIGSLLELRVLNLFETRRLDWDLDQVHKLKHLNDLGITINTQNSTTLTKLLSSSNQNLQMCTRHLLICNHKPQSTSSLSSSPNIYFEKYLEFLILNLQSEDIQPQSTSSSSPNTELKSFREFLLNLQSEVQSSSSSSSPVQPQSTTSSSSIIKLEKLQLLLNLETLRLLQFTETNMGMGMGIEQQQQQQHLGRSCFQKLGEISIMECNGLKDLTWVGYVPNLHTLTVSECKELEIIVVDDFGGSTEGGDEVMSSSSSSSSKKKKNKMVMNNVVQDIFKSLTILRIMCLPKLKSICSHAFPCLEYLLVSRCPELKKLPLDSGSNVKNTLRKIIGEQHWWNELRWEEDHDNNELVKSKFLPYFKKI